MIEPFIVRAAILEDADAIRALFAEVDDLHRVQVPWLFQKPPTEPRSSEFFEHLLANQESKVFVADTGTELVGVATALMRSAPDFALFIHQSWGVLDNIAVSRERRRRGVGAALMREAEHWVRARGANWIELGVYEFNRDARSFYEALGYAPVLTKLRKPL